MSAGEVNHLRNVEKHLTNHINQSKDFPDELKQRPDVAKCLIMMLRHDQRLRNNRIHSEP